MTAALTLATRKSPLALVQTQLVAQHLTGALGVICELLPLVSTGDRQAEWSLEKQGGKGLFTAELELALLEGRADVAIHSAKDLPGEMPAGLALAGYMPRADVRDVLVRRNGGATPAVIATGSPRRRAQLAKLFPSATYIEIRGNVDTRLNKIANGAADATVLAAAGLERLQIAAWPGLEFQPLSLDQMVPAIGQGAIAIQCRASDVEKYAGVFHPETAQAVTFERALQAALGAGCHTASAANLQRRRLTFFDERTGWISVWLDDHQLATPEATAVHFLRELELR